MMEQRVCQQCGGVLKPHRLRQYKDPLLGLEDVVILGAVEELRCAACGHVAGRRFPNLEGLLAAAATVRVMRPEKLSGKDIRFLRTLLDWPAKELARRVGVRDETVSRWETNKEVISVPAEKYLRTTVGLHLRDKAPLIDFDTEMIETMEIVPRGPARHEMRLTYVPPSDAARGEGAWKPTQRAA